MQIGLAVFYILCLLYVASAATFYAKYDGSTSSSCGTSTSNACKYNNLGPIINNLDAGDIINFLGNSNKYPTVTFSGITVGTLTNPVKVTGTSTTTFKGIRVDDSVNVKFDGVKVDGYNNDAHGIRVYQSSNITVYNCDITRAEKSGVYGQESPFLLVHFSDISESGDQCVKVIRYDEGNSVYRGAEDLFSAGARIEDNLLTECGADGMYISSQDAQMKRNRISNVGVSILHTQPTHGIYSKSDNAWIERNIIDKPTHNGITVRNTAIVRNNTVWNVGQMRHEGQTHLSGCCYTFYNDGPHDGGLVSFENNVCYQPGPYAKTGVNIMGGSYEADGYTFNILNNTIHFVSDAIMIEDATQSTTYIYNNKMVLSNSGTYVLGSTSGDVDIENNYQQQNAGSATSIFVRPGTGDFRDYRLLSSINFDEEPLSVYPRASWKYGRHSSIFTSSPYPSQ